MRLARFASLFTLASVLTLASAAAADPAQNSVDGSNNGISGGATTSQSSQSNAVVVDPTTGAATATIPFALPTARGQLQPHLSLVYSSDSGDGDAGMGWRLSLPSIERRSPNGGPVPTFQDTPSNIPGSDWDHYDRFVYNGQPLVPICNIRGNTCGSEAMPTLPATGGMWTYYRLAVDDGQGIRFFLSGDRQSWLVQYPRSFETLEFGATLPGEPALSGQPNDTDPSNAAHVYRWHLSRQYDSMGPLANEIVYAWANGVLTDIFDTLPTSGSAASAPSVNDFEHHVHLGWISSRIRVGVNTSVWRRTPGLLLSHLDVTSKPFQSTGTRELVRRYNLGYLTFSDGSTGNHPMLQSVAMEGRCSARAVLEAPEATNAAIMALPDADPGCESMPAMTMTYSESFSTLRPTSYTMAGGHDTAVRLVDGTWMERATSVVDLNLDGFPDLLLPALGAGTTQQAYLNQQGTSFQTAPVAASTGTLTFDNAQYLFPGYAVSSPLGDGLVDILPLSQAPAYRNWDNGDSVHSSDGPSTQKATGRSLVFSPSLTWTPGFANVPFQWDFRFQNNPAAMLVAGCEPADIDGDGLLDCWVQEEHWQGQFAIQSDYTWIGEGVYFAQQDRSGFVYPLWGKVEKLAPTDVNGAGMLGLSAVSSHTPMRDARLARDTWNSNNLKHQNADPIYFWADMDGDSILDIVFSINSVVTYWRGNGQGWFGDGTCVVPQGGGAPVCAYGTPQSHAQVMTGPQILPDPNAGRLYFHDLDGDGFADYIVTNENGLTVFFNDGGLRFNPNLTVTLTNDQLNGFDFYGGGRIAFADMNGSGVDDLVLLGHDIVYFDFMLGRMPSKLLTITNGLGATETIHYQTDAQALFLSGKPIWRNKETVASIAVDNGLAGTSSHVSTNTAYIYQNPVYDPRERALRGFQDVTVMHQGNQPGTAAPGSLRKTHYLISAPPASVGQSPAGADYLDDVYATLKGLPVTETVSDDSATHYFSDTHTEYQVRRLYQGMDGRVVRLVYPEQVDTLLYDPSVTAGGTAGAASLVDVDCLATDPNLAASSQFTPKSTAGVSMLRSTRHLDNNGNLDTETNYGRVTSGFGLALSGVTADVPVTTQSDFSTSVGDTPGAWIWKPLSVNVFTGSPTAQSFSRSLAFTYNRFGIHTGTSTTLTGTFTPLYTHAAGAPVASAPPAQSVEGATETLYSAISVDGYGNVLEFSSENGMRVTNLNSDPVFGRVMTSVSIGPWVNATAPSATPAETSLVMTYDEGLDRVLSYSGVSNDVHSFVLDTFGRTKEVHQPSLDAPGVASSTASLTASYFQDTTLHLARTYVVNDGVATWQYKDALGRPLVAFTQGDTTNGDTSGWVASGATALFPATGEVSIAYAPFFWTGADPSQPSVSALSSATGALFGKTFTYDGLQRPTSMTQAYLDYTMPLRQMTYHSLSVDVADGEDLNASGPHANTPTTLQRDGFGRTVGVITREKYSGVLDTVTSTTTYQPTGEVTSVVRSHTGGADVFKRIMTYDSMGRMVSNSEPNSTVLGHGGGGIYFAPKNWRYAYDDAGDLVGVGDARGCGKNIYYDGLQRPKAYDFSPCLAAQAPYSAPTLANGLPTGDGTEAFFVYDTPESTQAVSAVGASAAVGRATAIYDQGAHTQFAYDGRGHVTGMNRWMAQPGLPTRALSARYSSASFTKTIGYSASTEQLAAETTGAQSSAFLVDGLGIVNYSYSAGGLLKRIDGSYGTLLASQTYDASGRANVTTYGDAADTTSTATYDNGDRLSALVVSRGAAGPWVSSSADPAYTPPASGAGPTSLQQYLVWEGFIYDQAGNPTTIVDGRTAEWPAGAKPMPRTLQYDDAYRVTQVKYTANDAYTPPPRTVAYALPMQMPATGKRATEQDIAYDWLGNTTFSSDDANAFFDRSIGTIANGVPGVTSGAGANQLTSATAKGGNLSAKYDAAGNMVSVILNRTGTCEDASAKCTQRFDYAWDEVGRLSGAQRWDYSGTYSDVAYPAVPSRTADVAVSYAYDVGGSRVIKEVQGGPVSGRPMPATYNVDIFGSLRLNGAAWNQGTTSYTDDATTETVYVPAAGARVINDLAGTMPTVTKGNTLHVFFEVGDHLGSTAAIIDKATGELVEHATYLAYGAADSDYEPARWGGFHETYRFTSKEDDSEVGLSYFGARYYSPYLGRWISPDPLAVHALGADLNPYAYVSGRTLQAIDPDGLEDETDPFQEQFTKDDLTILDHLPDGGEMGQYPDGSYEILPKPIELDPAHSNGPVPQSGLPAPGLSWAAVGTVSMERLDQAAHMDPFFVGPLVRLYEDVQNVRDPAASTASRGFSGVMIAAIFVPGLGEGKPAVALGEEVVTTIRAAAGELPQLGGAAAEVRTAASEAGIGGHVHHLPSWAATRDAGAAISRGSGPSIWMKTADHLRTPSFGSSAAAAAYRGQQQLLIQSGRYLDAMKMDVDAIRATFGSAYDGAIQQMGEYVWRTGGGL